MRNLLDHIDRTVGRAAAISHANAADRVELRMHSSVQSIYRALGARAVCFITARLGRVKQTLTATGLTTGLTTERISSVWQGSGMRPRPMAPAYAPTR